MSDTNGVAAPTQENKYDFDRRVELDATPREIRGIRWKGRDYVLKSCPEKGHVKFTDAKIKYARMNDGKLVGLSGGGELPSLLLSFCLFRVVLRPDGSEAFQPLTQQHIQDDWPPHFVQELFEDAKRISHIDQVSPKTRAERKKELLAELAQIDAEERKERESREALVEVGPDGQPVGELPPPAEEKAEDPLGNLLGATQST
jgi:hypothetical protein